MKEKIAAVLAAHNYTEIQSNSRDINVFFRNDGTLIMAVMILDTRTMILSLENYNKLKNQIYQMFLDKGYVRVKILSLVIVGNPANGRNIAVNDDYSWLIDASSMRLLAYENQLGDYDTLRIPLENMLETEYEKKYNAEKLTVWKGLGRLLWFSKSPVTVVLILINIIVFIWLSAFGSTMDVSYMMQSGAMYPPYITENGEIYRLFTCMFMHFGLEHLAANMLSLYVFGSNVEEALGKPRYLALYILSGLLGNAASLYFHLIMDVDVVSAGASGAIFGVIGALFAAVILDRKRFKTFTPLKVAFIVGYSIFAGITGTGIDNSAHIGGLVAGFLLGCILYKRDKIKQ